MIGRPNSTVGVIAAEGAVAIATPVACPHRGTYCCSSCHRAHVRTAIPGTVVTDDANIASDTVNRDTPSGAASNETATVEPAGSKTAASEAAASETATARKPATTVKAAECEPVDEHRGRSVAASQVALEHIHVERQLIAFELRRLHDDDGVATSA